MKKIIATLSIVALVAIGSVIVIGQSGEGKKFEGKRGFGHGGKRMGKQMRGKRMMGRMFRNLDLTDAQKEQMKTIRKASRENMKPIRVQVRESQKTLNGLTENGNFDEAQVQAMADQLGGLHAQMIVERQRTKSAMFAVLTAEQKSKLAEFKQQHKEKREAHKAKRAERKAAAEKQETSQD